MIQQYNNGVEEARKSTSGTSKASTCTIQVWGVPYCVLSDRHLKVGHNGMVLYRTVTETARIRGNLVLTLSDT